MTSLFIRFLVLCLLAVTGAGLFPSAPAQVVLRLTATGGGQAVTLAPGESFRFTISIEAQGLERIDTFGFYLNSTDGVDANVSGYFSILDRASNTGLFSAGDLFWTDAEVAATPDSILSPSNALNLGASLATPFQGPGTFLLGTYTMQVALSVPWDSYSITPLFALWVDEGVEFSFNEVQSLTVNVVPEPGSAVLLLTSTGLLLRRGKRRRGN